jgi:hypothetical protein
MAVRDRAGHEHLKSASADLDSYFDREILLVEILPPQRR